jgi:hypothetical protein
MRSNLISPIPASAKEKPGALSSTGFLTGFRGKLDVVLANQAEIRGNGLFAAIPRLRAAVRRV